MGFMPIYQGNSSFFSEGHLCILEARKKANWTSMWVFLFGRVHPFCGIRGQPTAQKPLLGFPLRKIPPSFWFWPIRRRENVQKKLRMSSHWAKGGSLFFHPPNFFFVTPSFFSTLKPCLGTVCGNLVSPTLRNPFFSTPHLVFVHPLPCFFHPRPCFFHPRACLFHPATLFFSP